MPSIWILCANAHQATLRTLEDDGEPQELFRFLQPAQRALPGAAQDRLAQLFGECLADLLKRAVQEKLFERLVIVAPEPHITRLVYGLDSQVFDRVVGMLRRDATRMPPHELKALLHRSLPGQFAGRLAMR